MNKTAYADMRENAGKNSYIQILRALAIVAVVAIHNCPEGEIGVYIRPFVNFCVALFLFLSGYLTTEEKTKDIGHFYRKRIFRVMVSYIVWSIVYALVRQYSLQVFLFKFFTAQCCGVFYYIIVYVQMVLITPLLYKIAHTKYRNYVYIVTPVTIIAIYIYVLNDNSLEYPYYVLGFVEWLAYYYFGLAFHFDGKPLKCMGLLENRRKNDILLSVSYFIMLLIQLLEGVLWYDNGELAMAKTQVKLTSMFTSFALIMLVMYLKNKVPAPKNNIFIMIGNYSFGIYLTHMLIIDLLNEYTHFNYVTAVILVILIDVAVIYLCNRLLPKKLVRLMGFA